MTVVPDQPMQALEQANRVKAEAKQVKSEIRDGTLVVADALDDPRAGPLTIERLLGAQPRWGKQRVHRTLHALRWLGDNERWETVVWPDMRVRDLTERQKWLLVQVLDGTIAIRGRADD